MPPDRAARGRPLAHSRRPFASKSPRMSASERIRVVDESRTRSNCVELQRLERVDGRKLVDDQERPAGPRHAYELGDDRLRLRRVVQRPHRRRKVERERVERQRLAVADDHLAVGRRVGARPGRRLLVDFDGDHRSDPGGQSERKGAGSGADVQRPLVAAQRQQPLQVLGEGRGAPPPVARHGLRSGSFERHQSLHPRCIVPDPAGELVRDRPCDACVLLERHAVADERHRGSGRQLGRELDGEPHPSTPFRRSADGRRRPAPPCRSDPAAARRRTRPGRRRSTCRRSATNRRP